MMLMALEPVLFVFGCLVAAVIDLLPHYVMNVHLIIS